MKTLSTKSMRKFLTIVVAFAMVLTSSVGVYGADNIKTNPKEYVARPTIKVTLPKDLHVKISWSKVSGASGYQVYRKKASAKNWKCFKNVGAKKLSVIDNLYGNSYYPQGKNGPVGYDYDDIKYLWQYKVRAYKVINGKKVYGKFSKPVSFVPQWTIDEVYNKVWKYIEGVEWPVYEFSAKPDKNGNYLRPKKDGSVYHLKHVVGEYTVGDGTRYALYTNPANGAIKVPDGATYRKYTKADAVKAPEWPRVINIYLTKRTVVETMKHNFEAQLITVTAQSPLYWNPEFEAYRGVDEFTFCYQKKNCFYKIWCLNIYTN